MRLILSPLLMELAPEFIADLPSLLQRWLFTRYGVGNILNLAIAAGMSLQGWDLRGLNIAEVDFQNLQLQGVDCRDVVFDRCRFSQSLGSILCLIFSRL